MNRTRIITQSVMCKVYGWLSLLPVIGTVFIVLTIGVSDHVRRGSAGQWNPARRELGTALALAMGGIIVQCLTLGIAALLYIHD